MDIKQNICKLPGHLRNTVALVTGANVGCGLELTGELARRGAVVIMACRDLNRGYAAKNELIARYGEKSQDAWSRTPAGPGVAAYLQPIKISQLIVEQVDLASFKSIRVFAKRILSEYEEINLLIHNAGLMATTYMETEDGYELQLGVNHLGPLLLTDLLLPSLINGQPSRIIVVSSDLYKQSRFDEQCINLSSADYGPFKAYNQSKLFNIYFVRELAQRLDDNKIVAMAVHPGAVRTEVSYGKNREYNLFVRTVGISPWEGAQTALHCALLPNPVSGGYYSNCKLEEVTDEAKNFINSRKLWEISRRLVDLPPDRFNLSYSY